MIQDFLDEVLTGSPKYTLRDKNGNIINDDVDISLKTPIQQEGTPLNRNTFRNLQGDLYSYDRYNLIYPVQEAATGSRSVIPVNPTEWREVSSGKSGEAVYIGSDALFYGTKISGSYISGTISHAFDGLAGNYYHSSSTQESWIKMELPQPMKVTKVKTYFTISSTSYWQSCVIQGSNDNDTWTDLYTFSAVQTGSTTLTLSNTAAYKYYRMYATTTTATTHYYYEFSIAQMEVPVKYVFKSDMPLTSYETHKLINVIPNTYTVAEADYQEEAFTTLIQPLFSSTTGNVLENKYGKWVYTTSSAYSSTATYQGYNAFDGSTSTYYYTNDLSNGEKAYVTIGREYGYLFDETNWLIKPTQIYLNVYNYGTVRIQAFDPFAGLWETLTTYTASAKDSRVSGNKSVSTSKWYSAFRLEIERFDSENVNPRVYEFYVAAGRVRYGKHAAAKQITKFEEAELNINNKGNKVVDGGFVSGSKRSLIFNGSRWISHSKIITGKISMPQGSGLKINLDVPAKAVVFDNLADPSLDYQYGARLVLPDGKMMRTLYGNETTEKFECSLSSDGTMLTFNQLFSTTAVTGSYIVLY